MTSPDPRRTSRLRLLRAALVTAGAVVMWGGGAVGGAPVVLTAANETEDDTKTIVHVLNRVTFGPRPGDVARVRELGIEAYIERQLHPEQIDDSRLTQKLSRFETLEKATAAIISEYHLPSLMARRRLREETSRSGPPDEVPDNGGRPGEPGIGREEMLRRRAGLPPEIRRGQLVLQELMEQKLVRAVSSERQLQEVLVDFWFNHFNVSARKSPLIQPFLTQYERDVIRPHVFGRFRDLLGAVAESPAMLLYLDNWLSSDPDAPESLTRDLAGRRLAARGQARDQNRFRPQRLGFGDPRIRGRAAMLPPVQPGRRDGLNENYARELLELHTLGVDGGYTQNDVIEVARALTGWTIAPLPLGGGFRFEPRLHDDGEKHILGTSTDGYGKADGDAILDLLAHHPSTARFIASKLAGRLVADDPPVALIERAAGRFLETDGDLREVTRTILTSPEFFSAEVRRAKVKTPLEFVVSGVRALDGQVAGGQRLVYGLRSLGMPSYVCQPPTGYSDRADAWVNAGALIARMNFAVALVGGGPGGVPVTLPDPNTHRGAGVHELLKTLVLDDATDTTETTIAQATTPQQMAILGLGSPEFQRQ